MEKKKFKWQTCSSLSYELLSENARKNRSVMTAEESIFWGRVKGKSLGEKCRRQYIIGEYIVDFLFRESGLIVEIDGEYHENEEVKESDRVRQLWLEEQGYRVIRFSHKEIVNDIEHVINRTKQYLKAGHVFPL